MASLKQPNKSDWDTTISGRDSWMPGIERDPITGAPYVMSNGKKQYLSPENWGSEKPADTTGIFKARPRWNPWKGVWETPTDWGNITTMATAGLLTAGAANAAMAGPSVVTPGATTAASTAPAASTAVAGGVLPSTQIGTGMIGPIAGGTGIKSATVLGGGTAAKAVKDALKKTGKDTLKNSVGGGDDGMDFSELVKLMFLQSGMGALGSMFEKEPRQSFKGTSADPTKMLTGAQDAISGFKEPLMTRLRTPVTLPGASAPSTRYSGGPLPFEIGVSGSTPDRQANANNGDMYGRVESLLNMAKKTGQR